MFFNFWLERFLRLVCSTDENFWFWPVLVELWFWILFVVLKQYQYAFWFVLDFHVLIFSVYLALSTLVDTRVFCSFGLQWRFGMLLFSYIVSHSIFLLPFCSSSDDPLRLWSLLHCTFVAQLMNIRDFDQSHGECGSGSFMLSSNMMHTPFVLGCNVEPISLFLLIYGCFFLIWAYIGSWISLFFFCWFCNGAFYFALLLFKWWKFAILTPWQ